MADTSKDPNKAKRRVKNPESFRDRAIKASVEENKPSSSRFSRIFAPIKAGFSPLKTYSAKLSKTSAYKKTAKPVGFIGKIVFPSYFRSSFQELKLVTWPTLKQSRQLTFAVVVFAVIFGASIALLDYGLDGLFKNILLK